MLADGLSAPDLEEGMTSGSDRREERHEVLMDTNTLVAGPQGPRFWLVAVTPLTDLGQATLVVRAVTHSACHRLTSGVHATNVTQFLRLYLHERKQFSQQSVTICISHLVLFLLNTPWCDWWQGLYGARHQHWQLGHIDTKKGQHIFISTWWRNSRVNKFYIAQKGWESGHLTQWSTNEWQKTIYIAQIHEQLHAQWDSSFQTVCVCVCVNTQAI